MSLEQPLLPEKFHWPNLKSTLEDWFFRFLRIQALSPCGAIVAFAGDTPPEGWIVYDDTEYLTETYPALSRLIGVESSPGNFQPTPTPPSAPPVGQIWIIKV